VSVAIGLFTADSSQKIYQRIEIRDTSVKREDRGAPYGFVVDCLLLLPQDCLAPWLYPPPFLESLSQEKLSSALHPPSTSFLGRGRKVGARRGVVRLREEAGGGEHLRARTADDGVEGAGTRPGTAAAIFLSVLRHEATSPGSGRRPTVATISASGVLRTESRARARVQPPPHLSSHASAGCGQARGGG
jgi:hypothetical protein